jgi:biopolymer transport protein ExbD
MNFGRGRHREEPEMNFIPLIDMLLVLLIFLMVSTTYSKYADLKIVLPSSDLNPKPQEVEQLEVAIDRSGKYYINRKETAFDNPAQFAEALRQASGGNNKAQVIIHADADSVVHVMNAAQNAGLNQITFAAQAGQ